MRGRSQADVAQAELLPAGRGEGSLVERSSAQGSSAQGSSAQRSSKQSTSSQRSSEKSSPDQIPSTRIPSTRKKVDLFTDGACSGNPGPGGWGALLRWNGNEKELYGGEAQSTNNRMEMRAVIEGLRALREPCEVTIHTDSALIMNAFTQNWIGNWKVRGWRKADKKPVENRDLWIEMTGEMERHEVRWVKVKGHSGHAENERVDALAVRGSKEMGGRQR